MLRYGVLCSRGVLMSQLGRTALMCASWSGHLSVVQHLTGLGADVEATDRVSAVPTVCVSACVCHCVLYVRPISLEDITYDLRRLLLFQTFNMSVYRYVCCSVFSCRVW